MFCTKCGKQLQDGDKFCTGCGSAVGQGAAPKIKAPAQTGVNAGQATPVQPKANVSQAPVPPKASASQPVPAQPKEKKGTDNSGKKKKSAKGLIIFLSVIVVILALAVAFLSFWYLGGREMIYDAVGISTEESSYESRHKSKSDDADDEEDEEDSDKKEKKDKDSKKKKKSAEEVAEAEEEVAVVAPVGDAVVDEAPVAEEVVEEAVEEASEYILEGSDVRRISKRELEGFTAEDCRIARNEIYARHGRLFDDDELQRHFDSCSWYDGYISANDFREDMLSDIEMENRDTIISYEKEMGYR